jgi:hypothetical protein
MIFYAKKEENTRPDEKNPSNKLRTDTDVRTSKDLSLVMLTIFHIFQ